MPKAIAILGGTFDPVHLGHLHIAQQLLQRLPIQQIRFIPCYQSTLKQQPHANNQQRLAMLKLALATHSNMYIDTQELQRPPPSRSIDTLQALRQSYPDTPLGFVMGMDVFLDLPRWQHWQAILDYAHIILVPRHSEQQRDPHAGLVDELLQQHLSEDTTLLQQKLAGNIIFQAITELPISATQIRHAVQTQQSLQDLVPSAVAEYIHTHGLYLAH
jgi:nicotinate-nucleotide adenylyltransferase